MSFVKRNGNSLVLNGEQIKFCSFNLPNYNIIENPWSRITIDEQIDQAASLSQLGGKVFRIYTFSIPNKSEDKSKHLVVKSGYGTDSVEWEINEELFIDLDNGIKIAGDYNLKMIIPMIDRWEWWGGVKTFAQLYGKQEMDFYTDDIVINGWKRFLKLVIERYNSLTGIAYSNDPTILAWETGNELEINSDSVPDSWTKDIASYIKSLDKNHLVIDGSYGRHGWSDSILSYPDIDIYSNHYYSQGISAPLFSIFQTWDIVGIILLFIFSVGIFVIRYRIKVKITRYQSISLSIIAIIAFCGSVFLIADRYINQNFGTRLHYDLSRISMFEKAYLIGEIGIASLNSLKSVYNYFPESTAVGLLAWSLRGHALESGFRKSNFNVDIHEEHSGYYAYHYPGFPEAKGFGKDEIQVIQLTSDTIKKLGIEGNFTSVVPPVISDNYRDGWLRWRGTPGASSYSVESVSPSEALIASNVLDNKYPGEGLLKFDNSLNGTSLIVIAHGKFGTAVSREKIITI